MLRELFFGGVCLIGLLFLAGGMALRWSGERSGWRAALFSAGFGLVVLGALAPLDASAPTLLVLLIAATAQFVVGLSAIRRRVRR